MMRLPLIFLATLLTSTFFNVTFAQVKDVVRCATVEMDSIRHANDPYLQTNEEFEAWLAKVMNAQKELPSNKLVLNGVYTIPVVFHIIHNAGEAVGTGRNIPASYAQSQIDVLNEDFRRILGTNGYNTHPDGADTQIEFCMAMRRPDGSAFAEPGINRIDAGVAGFGAAPYSTAFVDATIKPYTNAQGWDPNVYMNIWICELSGGVLGYAQFPTTAIGGMGCGAQSVVTDGVVFTTTSIGKSAVTGNPGPYNEGRTATHEVGHWLGLRHIWGDGACGVDDFCSDTPLSDAANFGCPTTNSCVDPAGDPNDMVENYMDYTDDLCMNIFTNDQKMRMRTVLENSPIRASLIRSDACVPPNPNDASIVNVLNPIGDNCPGSITPVVTLRNRGANNLTSATINYQIDNGPVTTFAWTGNIAPSGETNVTLPAFTSTLGVHTLRSYSTQPNGTVDPSPLYDTTSLDFAVSEGYMPNYSQDFESGTFPPDLRWNIVNPNNDCYEWTAGTGTSSAGVGNNACPLMPNFNNGTNQDEYLYTPIFILPCNATFAQIHFDVAYRQRVSTVNDRLRIEISEDCGATWNPTPIYDKSGATLSTGGALNAFFVPSAAGDWRNETIDLNAFVTSVSKNVRFRFRATNGGNGGNLYIDNFSFTVVTPAEINVSVAGNDVLNNGAYDFGQQPLNATATTTFTIDNNGTTDLVLTGPINVTGTGFALNSTFGATTIPPGGSTTFSVDFTPTTGGAYSGTVTFGTNDCDEGTYTFVLNGEGNTSPPVANFTATPTTICQGSTVTYTDASSGATSWSWSFPGGTPATATGAGPHVVTYNTGGTFDATLNVTNAYGTDAQTQTGLITVIPGTGGAIPISEGFVNATFPPAGWSINNGGSAVTWVRNATQGNAPTAGNSAVIDNFSTDFRGVNDDLIMPKSDLTGLVSAQLQFDVAYARYDATFNDQLDVLVSTDCGQSYVTVYSKASNVLATDPDQTTQYTNPATWRTETIDMTPYIGNNSVDIIFRNISGYGQNLYLDNINLTGVTSSATAGFTSSNSTVCQGQSVTFTDNSTGATSWNWNFGAGATPATATGPGPHTVVYSTAGTSTVTLDVNGGASTSTQTVTVNPLPTVSAGVDQTVCAGSQVTLSGSGAVSYAWDNGVTDGTPFTPTATTTYTVTGTDANGCTNTDQVIVNVNALPQAPIVTTSGSTTICVGDSVVLTSSELTGNVWSNGAVTNSVSITTAGIYTVTYTDPNGCSATTSGVQVVVNSNPPVPTITASGSLTFCDGNSVDLTSSEPSGNNWSTGENTNVITVSTSGAYTVTYTDANGCSSTSLPTDVIVNALPVVTFASLDTTCSNYSPVTLTGGAPSGGTYSGTSVTSGQFDPIIGVGVYTMTYTYTDANGCTNNATSDIVVDGCAGIDEHEIENISVYPNPTFGVLNITAEGTELESVRIYDASGRLVDLIDAGNQSSIKVDMSEYSSGVYTIEVNSSSAVHRTQVFKN